MELKIIKVQNAYFCRFYENLYIYCTMFLCYDIVNSLNPTIFHEIVYLLLYTLCFQYTLTHMHIFSIYNSLYKRIYDTRCNMMNDLEKWKTMHDTF